MQEEPGRVSDAVSSVTGSREDLQRRRFDFYKGLRYSVWLIVVILVLGTLWFNGLIHSDEFSGSSFHWEALPALAPILIAVLCLMSFDVVEWFVSKHRGIGGAGVWSNEKFMLAGVVLPAMGVGLVCLPYGFGALQFDFPTCLTQMLLLTFIPAGNRIVWSHLLAGGKEEDAGCVQAEPTSLHERSRRPWRIWLLNGAVIGVSLTYLVFELIVFSKIIVHWTPYSWPGLTRLLVSPWVVVLATLVAFPIASFLAAMRCHFQLMNGRDKPICRATTGYTFLGATLALFAIFGPTLPHTFNRVLAHEAMDYPNVRGYESSDNDSSRAKRRRAAIRILRACASQQILLEDCYAPSLEMAALTWCAITEQPPSYVCPEYFRDVFYRVYGKAVSDLPVPWRFVPTVWMADWQRGFQHVGVKAAGLSLESSDIRGSIDSKAAVCYLEWTFVFDNDTDNEQEARTQIALPPGAVVSHASLWVRGKERQAAISERGRATSAYQSIVSQRRDPLLVTTAGPDRVLVQCFPVPRHGYMTVKIGITAPLAIDSRLACHLVLPSLAESNFAPPSRHHLDVRCNGSLELTGASAGGGGHAVVQAGLHAYHQSIADDLLRTSGTALNVVRETSGTFFGCWAQDNRDSAGNYCIERITESQAAHITHAVVVIDGSQSTGKHREELARALSELPPGLTVAVLFVSDEITSLSPDGAAGGGVVWSPDTANQIRQAPFVGGPDNWGYLQLAWEAAAREPDGAVIWIHGPQPNLPGGCNSAFDFLGVDSGSAAGVLKAHGVWVPSSSQSNRPRFYDVEVESGPNRVKEMLGDQLTLVPVARGGSLDQDLKALVQRLAGQRPEYTVSLDKAHERPPFARVEVEGAASSLVSLWGYQETRRLLSAGKLKEAVKQATDYGLVTPATAAIVLETRQQYKDFGIAPPSPTCIDTPTPGGHSWFSASARDANLFGGDSEGAGGLDKLNSYSPELPQQSALATNGTIAITAPPRTFAPATGSGQTALPSAAKLSAGSPAQSASAGLGLTLGQMILAAFYLMGVFVFACGCWILSRQARERNMVSISVAFLLLGASGLIFCLSPSLADLIGTFFFRS